MRYTEDPGYRERMSAIIKKKWQEPGFYEMMMRSRGLTDRRKDPKPHRDKSEAERRKWSPAYRERMRIAFKESHNEPDVKKRLSESMIKKWQDPEFRRKRAESLAARKRAAGDQ